MRRRRGTRWRRRRRRWRLDTLELCDEAESATMDGLDVPGRARVVAEGRAQLANRVGQRAFRNDRIGPNGVQQVIFGDELSRPCHEVAEHVPRARAQMNCLSVTEEAFRCMIQ